MYTLMCTIGKAAVRIHNADPQPSLISGREDLCPNSDSKEHIHAHHSWHTMPCHSVPTLTAITLYTKYVQPVYGMLHFDRSELHRHCRAGRLIAWQLSKVPITTACESSIFLLVLRAAQIRGSIWSELLSAPMSM